LDPVTLVQELEREVWDAWARRDEAGLRRLHDEDYVVADREGFFEWGAVLEGFPASELASFDFRSVMARQVSEDVVALLLRVTAEWGIAPPRRAMEVSVASVWVRRDGAWKSVLRHEITL
jgi:hypothetical protein